VKLTGFYANDENMPKDIYLRVEDPESGETRYLRVIGVLSSSAFFAGDVVTSQDTLDALADRTVPPQTYYFGLGSGVDASAAAKSLEKDFAQNGLQTQVTAQIIRQIGMMRALGFQKGQVRLAFLIESSFITLLGKGIGVILGLGFSGTLIDNISQNIPGLEYRVPWGVLLLVVLVGYSASLLTTFVPARRASSVYPAEALRYE
jgi:hypothetical protein